MKSIIVAVVTTLILIGVQAFRARRKASAGLNQLREAGKLLYDEDRKEFEDFFNVYSESKDKFWDTNEDVLADYFFEKDELRPIDVVYIFADQRRLVKMIDWRGEEMTGEIEKFIQDERKLMVNWTATKKLRATATEDNNRDGVFIISLLKTIDEDLSAIDHQLLVFDLGWDSYVFSIVRKATFEQVRRAAPGYFKAAKELRK